MKRLSLRILRERNRLLIVVQDVFNLDRRRVDMDDLVAPVHNVAFHRDEDVALFREEYLLLLARLAGKAEKLQRNCWRLWRRRWRGWSGFAWRQTYRGNRLLNDLRHRHKNVASGAAILRLLRLGEQGQIERWIQPGLDRRLFLPAAREPLGRRVSACSYGRRLRRRHWSVAIAEKFVGE